MDFVKKLTTPSAPYTFTLHGLGTRPITAHLAPDALDSLTRALTHIFGTDALHPLVEAIVAHSFCNSYSVGGQTVYIGSDLQVTSVEDLAHLNQRLYNGKLIAAHRRATGGDAWQLWQRFAPDVRIKVDNSSPPYEDAVRVAMVQEEVQVELLGNEWVELVPVLHIRGAKGLTKALTEYVLLRAFLHVLDGAELGGEPLSVSVRVLDCDGWVRENVLAYYAVDSWQLLVELAQAQAGAGGTQGALRWLAGRLQMPLFVAGAL